MATKIKRILPSDAARALGSISTPKKAASSAANGKRRGMLPLEALACTCGKCPDAPKTYCPRGRAIIRRRAKAEAQANAQGSDDMTAKNIEYSTVGSNGTSGGVNSASNYLAAALAMRGNVAATGHAEARQTDAAKDLEALRDERFVDAR